MLNRVRDQRPAHNNASAITSSVTVSSLKLLYYRLFARCYSLVGSFADRVVVNSSWTRGHIAELWGFEEKKQACSIDKASRLHLIYPPCNTTNLHKSISLKRATRQEGKRLVVSIGQFRPEKDHFLQIR
jgi:alpha-1,2-mannosyltransferase